MTTASRTPAKLRIDRSAVDGLDIVVALERRCLKCGGEGEIQQIDWLLFRQTVTHSFHSTVLCECSGCPNPINWLKGGEYLCDEHAGAPTENEEVPCGDCEGTGVVLTENGRAILELTRRYAS